MEIKSLKRLRTLMEINEVSQRQLAIAAGYKSHAYMGRILRGEVKTMDGDAALRLAAFFKVAVDDLFLIRVSSHTEHYPQRKVPA